MGTIELLELLGSEYTVEILGATAEPRTASEVSDTLGIPQATTYRRLDALAETDLLREIPPEERNTPGESGSMAYQRNVETICVEFEANTIELTQD